MECKNKTSFLSRRIGATGISYEVTEAKMPTATKLLEIDPTKEGTRRFQSQLQVGSDSADFIMNTDNVMRCWGYGEKGFGFYPFSGEYVIVSNIVEMRVQPL
jgi:hypothetical protein